MPKAFVNGIHMHYQTRGQGPDVVLVHGITSSLAIWYMNILPALVQRYRVTAYDLRGHGLSGLTETGYTSQDQAGDLLALLDVLGIAQARVVGHSFGGSVGLHAALLSPERIAGLVLLDCGVACLRHLRVIEAWAGWTRWAGELEKYGITHESFQELDRQLDISEVLRKSFDVPVQFGFRKGASRISPRLKKLVNGTRVGSEFREVAGLSEARLADITAPVFALYGTTSPYQKMGERLHAIMPNCRYGTLEGSGHFYLMEDPVAVLERIGGFLEDPPAFMRSPG